MRNETYFLPQLLFAGVVILLNPLGAYCAKL